MNKLILFLSLLIFNYSSSFAEVRYVSHSGSNTPPYLNWETAADSIMFAINISSFGDTIYVANGIYEEQVVMIPGLSLIGAGMDSCIIDTHSLITSQNSVSVKIADSCLLKGFYVIIYNYWDKGIGISFNGSSFYSLITQNRISNGFEGIYVGENPYVYKNLIDRTTEGIGLFNSSSEVRANTIFTEPSSTLPIKDGISIEAFDYSYKPIIDSNYIYAHQAYGIYKSFGASPIVSNNNIIIDNGAAMFLSDSDTMWIYNNLIYGYGNGIHNVGVEYLLVYNNYIGGQLGSGVVAGPNNIIVNNTIVNTNMAVEKWYNQEPPTVKYNCLWKNNSAGVGNLDTTNISADPMVVNSDSTKGDLDFHLQMFSPLIDRGDPDVLDKDGTRSDIGLYGGPFGEIYTYQDLAPRVPVNFSATMDSNYIRLQWNKNTEADFSHYNLYRDTTENFTTDSTTFVASIEDTFYLHIRPEGIENLYFKLTAVDSQGNESIPSEELHLALTGTKIDGEYTINDYRLFQNYPNPFNPTTRIGYRLKQRGYVKLYVYDIKGELIQTLVNQYQEGGYYEVEFSGKTEKGSASLASKLASGIYIYQIMVRSENNIPVFSDINKMIYLK